MDMSGLWLQEVFHKSYRVDRKLYNVTPSICLNETLHVAADSPTSENGLGNPEMKSYEIKSNFKHCEIHIVHDDNHFIYA